MSPTGQEEKAKRGGEGPRQVQGDRLTHAHTHARQLAQALSMQPPPGEGPPLLLPCTEPCAQPTGCGSPLASAMFPATPPLADTHIWPHFEVHFLLVGVPQLLGGFGFLGDVRLLGILD